MMRKKPTRIHQKNKQRLQPSARNAIQPFMGHVQELRQRLFFIAVFAVIFTAIGAAVRETLIDILLSPAQDQHFIYTSPGGGFDFNFRVCLYFGLALSVPVLIFNLFRYLEPLLKDSSVKFIVRCTLLSYILAGAGVAFGYFVSLPAALYFLLNQFGTDQIEALLSIQDYLAFVMIYLVGFALLFQIPLVMLFINRIKPLKPSHLLKNQRFVITGAAVLAAVLTPTGDALNMAIMAIPIIGMYQLGVILVWLVNRAHKVTQIEKLRLQDEQLQQVRQQRLATSHFELAASDTQDLEPTPPLPPQPHVTPQAPDDESPEPSPPAPRPAMARPAGFFDIQRPSYNSVLIGQRNLVQ